MTFYGYVAYEATTGPEALELARAHLPNLILMDLRLPGLDGYTVPRILKGDETTKQIPMIALTAFAMEGNREKALHAGCDGYITKPIETRSFTAAVRRFLGTGSGAGMDQGDGDSP